MFRTRSIAAVFVLTLAASGAQAAPEAHGLELMNAARKLSEGRFQSPRSYEHTLKFFRDKFRGWKNVKWSREVSLPTVKYVHIQNTNSTGSWSGVNIYQLKNGEVRVYVLPRVAEKVATAGQPKG